MDAGATWASGRAVLAAARETAGLVGKVGGEGSSCDS